MRSRRLDVRMLSCLLISCIFLPLCSAQNITCSVSQVNNLTTYSISYVPHVVEASECVYQWLNASGYVLANNKGALPELETNIKTLITPSCFNEVIYTRSCLSEDEAYTINCTTSCGRHDLFQGNNETSYHWAWWVLGALVLVVGVVFLGFCCCKSRDKALRVCSSGCMYTAVKQNPTDVEAGKE